MNQQEVKSLFNHLNDAEKLDFLNKALENSTSLQEQFIQFFTNRSAFPKATSEEFDKQIVSRVQHYISQLEDIELEETDWDKWEPPHDEYIPEYEAAQRVAEQEVEDLFEEFKNDLTALINKCDLVNFFAGLAGLVIACRDAEVDDPYDNLGDPNEFFLNTFKEISEELVKSIETTIFRPDIVELSVRLVFDTFKKGKAVGFYSTVHDGLLQSALKKCPEKSNDLYDLISDDKLVKEIFPKTSVFIMKNSNKGGSGWTKLAEQLSEFDISVALDLLEHYHQTDKPSFYRVAKKAYDAFPHQLNDFLLTRIDDKYDVGFSKVVLEGKIKSVQNIQLYPRLKKLMDEKELENFREGYSSRFYVGFYISMLEDDCLFDKILEVARKWDNGLIDLDKIIKPIASRYPAESLKIAGKIILKELENSQGRGLYSSVATVLHIINVGTHQNDAVKQFAADLVKKFNRRSALKEELKNKKLI
jgi:hypothetical protein